MLIFPNIDPVLVHIGPLAIHWYGVMYLVAFASALWLGNRRAAAAGFTKEQVSDLIFFGALGAVLGGRMGYIFFYQFEAFVAQPTILLRVWEGGMSFHGGLLGVIVAILLYFSSSKQIANFCFNINDLYSKLIKQMIGVNLNKANEIYQSYKEISILIEDRLSKQEGALGPYWDKEVKKIEAYREKQLKIYILDAQNDDIFYKN